MMDFVTIEPKEKSYFFLRLVISLLVYSGLAIAAYLDPRFIPGVVTFLIFFVMLIMVRNGLFVGLIKANAIKINKEQMPEIYQVAEELTERFMLNKVPDIYLLQMGGSLNAFATRLFRGNYIVLYSDLAEGFYNGNTDAVKFVMAHEMAHIKRNHLKKDIFLTPSAIIPFLSFAYYRACEYTCDNFGKHYSPQGAVQGILTLAAGPSLRTRVNAKTYVAQTDADAGFWRWLAEKFSTHPNLHKRLKRVYDERLVKQVVKPIPVKEEKPDDHSRYMPQ